MDEMTFQDWFGLHVALVSAELCQDDAAVDAVRARLAGTCHPATALRIRAMAESDTRRFFAVCRQYKVKVPAIGNAIPFE